jgi:hypothetical protein
MVVGSEKSTLNQAKGLIAKGQRDVSDSFALIVLLASSQQLSQNKDRP